MTVLDGRNPNAVPAHIDLPDFENLVEGVWYDLWTEERVILLELDGRFVPCVAARGCYTLCASYKTERGFQAWKKRFYPKAYIRA